MANLRILGEDDVRAAINADTALDLARRTLKDQADGHSTLSSPSAMVLDATTLGGPRFKFKAAAVGHLNASGIRLLSHPGPTAMKTCNYSAVYDHSGFLLSGLVSEQFLSRIRTAAFGAVAVEALANSGQLTVASSRVSPSSASWTKISILAGPAASRADISSCKKFSDLALASSALK